MGAAPKSEEEHEQGTKRKGEGQGPGDAEGAKHRNTADSMESEQGGLRAAPKRERSPGESDEQGGARQRTASPYNNLMDRFFEVIMAQALREILPQRE